MNKSIPKNSNLRRSICPGLHSSITEASKDGSNEPIAIKSQTCFSRGQKHHGLRHSHRHSHHRSSDDDIPNQSTSISDSNESRTLGQKSTLRKEAKIYKMLAGAPGFPMYKHFISDENEDQLVLELLGPNLSSLINENIKSDACNTSHLSLKTVLQIADQALLRIQYFHMMGYVHGDIKPENFVIGKFPNSNQIHLIGMSLARRYLNKKNGEHLPFTDKHNFQGSLIFSSINLQRGLKMSRRDDLESLGYVLVFLLTGSLPWSFCTSLTDVLYCKMNTSVKFLCDGLPPEFELFINSVRCLSFCDEPDYSYYRQMFRDLFIKKGYIYDYVYDWSIIDKCKTKYCISAISCQTNPQFPINSLEILSKNNKRVYAKSNTPHAEMLDQLSTHQKATNNMLRSYHHHHETKPISSSYCDEEMIFFTENHVTPLPPDEAANSQPSQKSNTSRLQKPNRLLLTSPHYKKTQNQNSSRSSGILSNFRKSKNISKQ